MTVSFWWGLVNYREFREISLAMMQFHLEAHACSLPRQTGMYPIRSCKIPYKSIGHPMVGSNVDRDHARSYQIIGLRIKKNHITS